MNFPISLIPRRLSLRHLSIARLLPAVALFFWCAHAIAGPAITVTVTSPSNGLLTSSTVGCWNIYELTMADPNSTSYTNIWEDPIISAVFTGPSGQQYSVGGFYYNSNQYKLRFVPRVTGTWKWTLSFGDSTGTFTTSGSFTAVSSTNAGFLRVSASNQYGMVTESGSTPIYLNGYQGPLPGGTTITMTDISQANSSTDAFWQPCSFGQMVANMKNGGFNFFREMNQGDGFYHLVTANSGNTGKNIYSVGQGVLCDEVMQALQAQGIHVVMTMIKTPVNGYALWVSGTTGPLSTVGMATMRYHQYLLNRWGAYVDIWEQLNEQGSIPQSYSQAISSYLASGTNISSGANAGGSPNDPYDHVVTTNFYPGYSNCFSAETWHGYYASSAFTAASSISGTIGLLKNASGQPVMGTEIGMDSPYGSYAPLQLRGFIWSAFMNQATLVFWGEGGYLDAFQGPGNGYANMTVGPDERNAVAIQRSFLNNFDPSAVPLTTATTAFEPGNWTTKFYNTYALGSANDLAVYIVNGNDSDSVTASGTLSINVPGNNMQGWWINPGTGALLQPVTLNSGQQKIITPPFQLDIALRAQANGGSWPSVQFSSPSYEITATNGSFSVPVYNTGGTAVSVNYSMTNGLAQAGVDYTSGTGTLSWGAGDTSPRSITIPLIYSGSMQATRDFVVSLTNPSTGAPIANALVQMAAPVANYNYGLLSQPTYIIPAGTTVFTGTVNRYGSGNGPLIVWYDTKGGSAVANTDYTAIAQSTFGSAGEASGTGSCMTWASGDMTPKTFTVNILNQNPASVRYFTLAMDDGEGQTNAGMEPGTWLRGEAVMVPASGSPGALAFDTGTNTGAVGITPGPMVLTGYGVPAATYTVYASGAGNVNYSIPINRMGGSAGALTGTVGYSAGSSYGGFNYISSNAVVSFTDGQTSDGYITGYIPSGSYNANPPETGTMTIWMSLTTSTSSAAVAPFYACLNIVYPPPVFAPSIGIQPQSQTTTVGQGANLGVEAAGSNLTYQWYLNGTAIAGATNATYSIASTGTGNGGSYKVTVSNGTTVVTSTTTTLAVNSPPAINAAGGSSVGSIQLNWTASYGAQQYLLQRSLTSGSGYAPIATIAASSTTYTDTALTGGTTYYYQVSAVDVNGTSAYSTPVASAQPYIPGTYWGWAYANFGPYAGPPSYAAEIATPAGDGISNLVKYALGIKPYLPYSQTAAGLPTSGTAVSGSSRYLTLTFTGTAPDVTYTVQSTGNLTGSWSALQTWPSGPGTVTGTDIVPLSSTNSRFINLQMTGP